MLVKSAGGRQEGERWKGKKVGCEDAGSCDFLVLDLSGDFIVVHSIIVLSS